MALTDPAWNVTVALLVTSAVFAAAVTVTPWPDSPARRLSDTHDASTAADHVPALVVGTTTWEPPAAGADHVDGDTDNVGAAPAWETTTVLGIPSAVNVTVPWRGATDGFACADTVATAPDAPEAGLTASHDAFADAAHAGPVVVATTDTDPPGAGAAHDSRDTDSTGVVPAWVTSTAADTPPAV
jgi:hypothetical protein